MKRTVIFPIIAIVLLAVWCGPYLLLLLIVIPIGYFFINRLEKAAPKRVTYANVEEVEAKYGQADDVVELSATRANELQALMLFYKAQDKVISYRYERPASSHHPAPCGLRWRLGWRDCCGDRQAHLGELIVPRLSETLRSSANV